MLDYLNLYPLWLAIHQVLLIWFHGYDGFKVHWLVLQININQNILAYKMKRIESLDIFRGICAILVIFFHIRVSGTVTELSISRNAFIFVDFFFVLSGFVIAMKYTSSSDSFKQYMTTRFFRIYPLFFFLMTASIATEFLKYIAHKKLGIEFGSLPFSGGSSPDFIPYYYTLTQAWLPWVQSDGFLYPSWSISIEFYMYIALWFLISRKINKLLTFVFLAISISISLYLHGAAYPNDVIRGMAGIPLGALAFYLRSKIRPLPYMEIPMIVICYFAVSLDYSYKYFCVAASFFITIVVFSHDSGFVSKIIINKALKYVGKLSYSIYLTHSLVLYAFVLLSILAGKITHSSFSHYEDSARIIDFGNVFINNLFVVSAILFTIIVSHFTNKYIEIPFMHLAKRSRVKSLA